MKFLGFANYFRDFIKGYADKMYPMQQLMRNNGKKEAFENIKRELCEQFSIPLYMIAKC